MFLYCVFSPHYTFLWHEDDPQWPKHVVSVISRIQRQLCFDVPTPSLFLRFVYYPRGVALDQQSSDFLIRMVAPLQTVALSVAASGRITSLLPPTMLSRIEKEEVRVFIH